MSIEKLNIMPPSAGKYPEDDIPNYILKIQQKKKSKEIKRNEVKKGNVVIILEGEFTGRRVVVIGNKDNKLICVGVGIPMFLINDRYVLKTSVFLNLNLEVEDNLEECGKEFSMKETESNKYDEIIFAELERKKMVKKYMTSCFELPEGCDFYELNY